MATYIDFCSPKRIATNKKEIEREEHKSEDE